MNCPICKAGDFVEAEVDEMEKVGKHIFHAKLPGLRCTKCGETAVHGGAGIAFEMQVAVTLARAGEKTPEAFRFMRETIGMPAKELAELLGWSPAHISRVENGKRALDDRATAILGMLVHETAAGTTMARESLKAVRQPKALGRRVDLTAEHRTE